MKKIGLKIRAQKDKLNPVLGSNSDPSEEYDSFQQNVFTHQPTQLHKSHHYITHQKKTSQHIDDLNFYNGKFNQKSRIGPGKVVNNSRNLVEGETLSKDDNKTKSKIKSKTASILPRLLKSLSFLAVLGSINSFSLALEEPFTQHTSNRTPFEVSLIQSNSSLSPIHNSSTQNSSHHNGFSGSTVNNTSLIETRNNVLNRTLGRFGSFLQSGLISSRADKKKRSGMNRRGPKGKKGKGGEDEEKRNKWTDFMAKFDIAKVHGSGVYVDLGESATVGSYDYRMPIGKCPVVGKAIILENGADFLSSITHHDPKERGLGFPATKVASNSSKLDMENQLLSPISAQVLRSWNYKHESDLSNCAEYSRNIVPGSNRNSKYRYPFVYDESEKLCYILYSPMQYNQGVKYCDQDSPDEGTSSLACMYPDKSKEDSHLFYGTSGLHMDWPVVCPVYPIRDSIFGSYDDQKDECVPIEPIFEEEAEDYEACAKIIFEYSPSDVDISTNNQKLSDVDLYKEAMNNGKLSTALSIMFAPRYSEDRPIYTKGVGINWATYSVEEKKCNILDVVPSCLIISNGHYALTSLSSPNEEDAINYPCDIVQGKGFLKNPNGGKKNAQEPPKEPEPEEPKKEGAENKPKEKGKSEKKNEKSMPSGPFTPYTSLKKEGFECSKYTVERVNKSCGVYYECSETPVLFTKKNRIYLYIILAVSLVVLAVLAYFGYRYYSKNHLKKHNSQIYEDDNVNNYYNEDFDDEQDRDEYASNVRGDQIWSRHTPDRSEVTPVRISRLNH
ncbi:integral membrane protein (apical merozoite antigen), putative [Theileria annulata]|uniref:Integral membrane protein (Apical merozoite antigen), putative n=1 Tax=Theileria annulata TaxID=5874 RepID=Q4UHH9_THEAN|nr:integral membrane protein (apical merozoite antigen), putative [Theileria annulata]CAI73460.1 integral membrane protein (apical merozoite antigen), putative [Theileria annulata]|eukprot:XP_954137.1 integral membrane protein (apical merozoite antigen), putative [Theileria annulata]